MSIRFAIQGRQGTLDVAQYALETFGPEAKIIGVKEGLVRVQKPDGKITMFALGDWCNQQQAEIVYMEGFNSPETALDQPPNGMNFFDQSVFYNDGMDI